MKPCDTITTQMSEAIDDRLDANALVEFEAHLKTCKACRREYAALRQTVALLHAIPAADAPADMPARVRRRLGQSQPSRLRWKVIYLPATRIALAASLLAGISIYAFLRPEPASRPESELADRIMMRESQQDRLSPVEMSEDMLSHQPDSPPIPGTPREPESPPLTRPEPAPSPAIVARAAPEIQPLQPGREHSVTATPQPSRETLRESRPAGRDVSTDAVGELRAPAPAARTVTPDSHTRRRMLRDENDGRLPAVERETWMADSMEVPQALDFSVAADEMAAAGPPVIPHDKPQNAKQVFAADMYRNLTKSHGGNIVFSPHGISTVLDMLSANAGDPPADYLHGKESNAFCLTGGAVNADYKTLLQYRYDAEIFDGDQDSVNAWAFRNTHGRIPVTLEKLSPGSVGVILNTIRFDATWQEAFDSLPFQDSPEQPTAAPLMVREGFYRLLEKDGFRAVAIPYRDTAVSMVVFLPDPGTGLQAIESRLTGNSLADWLAQLRREQPQTLRLVMPEFTIKADAELVETIIEAGISGLKKLSGTEANARISRIKHRIFINVNATGTQTAAVTAGETATAPPVPGATAASAKPAFKTDRPFIFMVQDNQSNTILLMGRLIEPAD